MNRVNLVNIKEAKKLINAFVYETPIMESQSINALLNRRVYFKCEHLQKTGSFKIRGAINNILTKNKMKTINGVVTHSSGNHGQAVALAAKLLNLSAIVVVPKCTPSSKCEAIEHYGAKLILCEDSPQSRVETCAKLSEQYNYEIIHPYDDYDTIIGQGTCGLEFINEVSQLDAVLISISGGGLCSGCAVAIKSINPKVKIYCVEPDGKELERSICKKERLWSEPPKFLDTIAEGIKTQQPGQITFPILCEHVEPKVLTVKDSDMIFGMKMVMKYLKQVVEPAAGAPVGALFKYNNTIPAELTNIGVVLCGGNLDIEPLFNWFKS